MERSVSQILHNISHRMIGKDRRISGLFYDSRRFVPGFAFIALKGQKIDGHSFIRELYLKGCDVFFIQDERYVEGSWDATFVLLDDTRAHMGTLARNFWGGQKSKVIGVTGTKGKSSTVKIIAHSMNVLGKRCGVIGSLWWKLTTPEAVDTFYIINNSSFEFFAMEVTSIATVQHRVDGIVFDLGVFLGLGHDHLDLHGTMENYFLAKFSFLEMVGEAVVVYLDRWGEIVLERLKGRKRVISFSDECMREYGFELKGGEILSSFRMNWKGEDISFRARFFGHFNWKNFLSAYIVLRELGFSSREIVQAFEEVWPLAGRMEAVNLKPFVFVDYAHNPESLEVSLLECIRLRERMGGGRLFVIFGCGGDRDKEKRPLMGKRAYELADVVIITSDNPRGEDPSEIAHDILAGIQLDGARREKEVMVILDRKSAIEKALSMARDKDVILIAGKGHESYQIIGDRVIDHSDKEVVMSILRGYEP